MIKKNFFLVENIESIEKVVKTIKPKNPVWITTSPGVVEYINEKKYNYINPETLISYKTKDNLAKFAHQIINKYSLFLDKNFKINGINNNYQKIFGGEFFRTLFPLLYKSYLLNLTMEKIGDKLICVGSPEINKFNNLNFNFLRFTNIFSIIAKNSIKNVSNLNFKIKKSENNSFVRRMSFFEKILSILNNTLSSFLFKIWFKFQKRKFIDKNKNKTKKKIFVCKYNETIQEIFLNYILKGYRFFLLTDLIPKNVKLKKTNIKFSTLKKDLWYIFYKELKKSKIKENLILVKSFKLFLNRLVEFLIYLKSVVPQYIDHFEKIYQQISNDDKIFTNYFARPHERLFGILAMKKKINVFAFEHGITLGLSKNSNYSIENHPAYAITLAPYGIYQSKESMKQVNIKNKKQKKFYAGLPKITSMINLINLQKYIIKKYFKIPLKSKVIIHVADAERNNLIYGPHSSNDLEYFQENERITEFLCKKNTDSTIILKLYPTKRYLNLPSFSNLKKQFKNLFIIRNFEFRFLRIIADEIYLISAQSSLGWALGMKKPTFLFETASTPFNIKNLKAKKITKLNYKNIVKGIYKVNLKIPPANTFQI